MKSTRRAELRLLEERIAELEAENAHLRDAAEAFGALAERLNQQLRAERDARHNGGGGHHHAAQPTRLPMEPL